MVFKSHKNTKCLRQSLLLLIKGGWRSRCYGFRCHWNQQWLEKEVVPHIALELPGAGVSLHDSRESQDKWAKALRKATMRGRPWVCSFERCRPQKCRSKQDMVVVCRYNFGLMWKRRIKLCLLQRAASGPVGRIKGSIFGSLSSVCCTRKQNGVSWNDSCALQCRLELAGTL